MIKIREVFVCKPGMASKFAKMMKESMSSEHGKMQVMTDMVGDYNTVVMEREAESLTAYEKMSEEFGKNMTEEDKKKMSGYTDMYLTGRREIFKIW